MSSNKGMETQIELAARLAGLEKRLAALERLEQGVWITAWKSHRVADFTFVAANTWTDIPWDTKVADECAAGIAYYNEGLPSEDTSILVATVDDILYVSGCVRPLWTGAPNTRVIVATRILISENEGGVWTEARCLQEVNEREAQSNEVGTQHYSGTVGVRTAGTWIKLQARVGSTDMELAGWPTFDSPVAASIQLHGMGVRVNL